MIETLSTWLQQDQISLIKSTSNNSKQVLDKHTNQISFNNEAAYLCINTASINFTIKINGIN